MRPSPITRKALRHQSRLRGGSPESRRPPGPDARDLLRTLAERRDLLQSRRDDVALLNETAWLLATNPNESIRNGTEAVELAQRAVRMSAVQQPAILGTLAAAYAETGRFTDAVQIAQQALALAFAENKVALADALRAQLKLYRFGLPYREMQQSEVSNDVSTEEAAGLKMTPSQNQKNSEGCGGERSRVTCHLPTVGPENLKCEAKKLEHGRHRIP